MSYYNKHDNELNCILQEETKAKEDLVKLQNNCKSNNNKICDFKAIFLQNRINKLHHKIKDIMIGNHPDPNDGNNIA